MVGPAVGVELDSRTPRRSCRSCPVHSSPATPDGPRSHIADTSVPVDAAAGCRRDSAESPAAPRWRRPRRAASRHRAPPPAWPYFPSVLDSVENVMECEVLYVMGAIITQCVSGCTWHRCTALRSIALWHAVYNGTRVSSRGGCHMASHMRRSGDPFLC